MGLKRYHRHSARVIKSQRWKALRLQALRRDGWRCVQCGSRHRLEVDHIRAVRHAPEQAFDLGNLQVLCASCHAQKTRIDIGLPPPDPEREKWVALVRDMHQRF